MAETTQGRNDSRPKRPGPKRPRAETTRGRNDSGPKLPFTVWILPSRDVSGSASYATFSWTRPFQRFSNKNNMSKWIVASLVLAAVVFIAIDTGIFIKCFRLRSLIIFSRRKRANRPFSYFFKEFTCKIKVIRGIHFSCLYKIWTLLSLFHAP